ncbi:MAG: sialate O-acetylesterase [Planctomycetota bacterium]
MHRLVPTSLVALCLATSLPAFGSFQLPDPLPRPDGKSADMSKPVQVYILMGQSNMLGFGKVDGLQTACNQKGLYPYLVEEDGSWTVRQDVRYVRVMCSGSGPSKTYNNEWMTVSGNFGPELGIGHYVGYVTDAPVLILKSCIGNRSLGYDLLPPTADGYEGNPRGPRRPKSGGWYAGVQYDGDVAAAKEVLASLPKHYPGAGRFEVAGFFWWQGDKDFRNAEHAARYEQNLLCLIESLRADFDAPDAKFVCASLGQTRKGSGGPQGQILDAVLNIDGQSGKYPKHKGKVATVYSNPLSMGGSSSGHYGGNPETYMNIGQAMGQAMAQLILDSPGGVPGVRESDLDGALRGVFKAIVDGKLGRADKTLRAFLENEDGAEEQQVVLAEKLEEHLAGLVDGLVRDMDKGLDDGDYCRVRNELAERGKDFEGIPEFESRRAEWTAALATDEAVRELAVGDAFAAILQKKERAKTSTYFELLAEFRAANQGSFYAARADAELQPIQKALDAAMAAIRSAGDRGDLYAKFTLVDEAEAEFKGIAAFDEAHEAWAKEAKSSDAKKEIAAGKDYAEIFGDLAKVDDAFAEAQSENEQITGKNQREKAEQRALGRYEKSLASLAGKLEKLASKYADTYYGKAAADSHKAYVDSSGKKLVDARSR